MLGNIPWLTVFFLGGVSWIVGAIWPAINKRRRRRHKSPPPSPPLKRDCFLGQISRGNGGVARHKNAPPSSFVHYAPLLEKGKGKKPIQGWNKGGRDMKEGTILPVPSPVFADKKVFFVYIPSFPSASIQKVPFICGKKIRETFTLYL